MFAQARCRRTLNAKYAGADESDARADEGARHATPRSIQPRRTKKKHGARAGGGGGEHARRGRGGARHDLGPDLAMACRVRISPKTTREEPPYLEPEELLLAVLLPLRHQRVLALVLLVLLHQQPLVLRGDMTVTRSSSGHAAQS